MDLFTQNKLYKRWLLFFLCLNIFFMGLTIYLSEFHEDSQKSKQEIQQIAQKLQKELQLSQNQMNSINQLRLDFFKKEKLLKHTIRAQRDSMNLLMFSKNTDTLFIREIARRVADNEFQMELYRIDQATKLKAICNPDQIAKFEIMVMELKNYFKPIKNPTKNNK